MAKGKGQRIRASQPGGRPDTRQMLQKIQEQMMQTQEELGQKTVSAPVAGRVYDTLYEPGEWVAAGRPVVVLRRILSHLVLKKRAAANQARSATWQMDVALEPGLYQFYVMDTVLSSGGELDFSVRLGSSELTPLAMTGQASS